MEIQYIFFGVYLLATTVWYFIKRGHCQKLKGIEKIFFRLPWILDFIFLAIVLNIRLLGARKEEKKVLMNQQYKNLMGER